MKNFLMLASLMLSSGLVQAGLVEEVENTLLEHVSLNAQVRSGETKLALMDSVIIIGRHQNEDVLALQIGFAGETVPEPGEVRSANFLGGAQLRLDPFIKDVVKFPEHWRFLNSVKHGPGIFYDFRERLWYGGYQIGLEFQLNPR